MSADKPWPTTARQDIAETLHGVTVHDPYRWLESEEDPGVQRWMELQDDYARAVLSRITEREALAARVKELLYFDALGPPSRRGNRYFYTRKHADREKTVVYWRTDSGAENVLFDPNAWSDAGDRTLAGWWPSWDGKRVAYSISENNSDETRTRIIDVDTGADLPEAIDGTRHSGASWTPDGSGFYYTWTPPASRTLAEIDRMGFAELRFHKLGTDPAFDSIVHPATHDPEKALGGGISRDGHWLVAFIQHGWSRTEVFFKDARVNAARWTPLVTGIDANFDVTAWRDHFYVTTNEGAPRSRVYVVDPHRPQRDAWHEIVPQSAATLQHAQVIGDHLVMTYLDHAMSRLEVRGLDGKLVRDRNA